jgi:hypothetical protein
MNLLLELRLSHPLFSCFCWSWDSSPTMHVGIASGPQNRGPTKDTFPTHPYI